MYPALSMPHTLSQMQWNLVKTNSKKPNLFNRSEDASDNFMYHGSIFYCQPYTYKMPNILRIRNGHLCVYLASYIITGVCINRCNDSFYQEFCSF